MKKLLLPLFAVVLLAATLLTAGCDSASPKTFSSDAGISLTLTSDFVEKEVVNYTYTLQTTQIIVYSLKEEFTQFQELGLDPASISLTDYAEMVISASKPAEGAEVSESDGLTVFSYEYTAEGKDYYYYSTVYKGSDAFWTVQFCCETKNKETFQDTFVEYAKSVVVK